MKPIEYRNGFCNQVLFQKTFLRMTQSLVHDRRWIIPIEILFRDLLFTEEHTLINLSSFYLQDRDFVKL